MGEYYIVMEYIKGNQIDHVILKRGAFTEH